ncbi:MAG: transcription termination/antitermination protein NusG [Victivallaceae bacterium]|nr:transcription termination/antitermination protein NusG [Victivallaceae bacterium]
MDEEKTVAPQEQPAPAEDNRGQWFVLHTLSGHEKKVCESIKRQICLNDQAGVYEACVPMHKVVEVRQRQPKVKSQKVFPGYILVRMDLYDELGEVNEKAWFLVRSVQGVLGFVGNINHPVPLTEQEVKDILGVEEDENGAPVAMAKFDVGEVVRITNGPFEGFEGTVTEVDGERGLLKVMVSIFGRSTSLELESWQVERVN